MHDSSTTPTVGSPTAMLNKHQPPTGILLVDKNSGPTSHTVVSQTRRALGTRKVGHAGTLDPLASGLLVLGVRSTTRLLGYLVGADKEYLATIRLGASSVSDDSQGELTVSDAPERVLALSRDQLLTEIGQLTGDILQSPSAVSAIKVDGKRAYALVRSGEEVELKKRPVTVSRFEILAERRAEGEDGEPYVDLDVLVECSSGTYIRALARDLGIAVGVGGHLTALRRTRVGPFHVDGAVTNDALSEGVVLLSAASVARALFPSVELNASQSTDLMHGKRLSLADYSLAEKTPIAAIDPNGTLIGLLEVSRGISRVLVNFPTEKAEGSRV